MPAAIRVRDLRKTFPGRPPVEAVRGLDLDVATGECFGLLGPNGAGKTTTIEILEGLSAPSGGEVEVLGLSWRRDEPELRRRIGVTLQETRFADKLSVEETLRMFASFQPDAQRVEESIAAVGLQEKRKAWVVKLSGGQRQRLAIACALVGEPDLLFLDEPTTGLDPQSRRQLWEVVRALKAQGRTILLTTHYMDEAEKLCDRVAVVDHGRVIALGTPAELIRTLGCDHVIEFALEGGGAPDLERLQRLPSVRSARLEDAAEAGAAAGAAQGAGKGAGMGTGLGAGAGAGVATVQLNVAEPHRAIPALLAEVQAQGRALATLHTRHASLEDVFVALTGRHLRDD
jgi:ABC-2 type transport system ATP-binding protein